MIVVILILVLFALVGTLAYSVIILQRNDKVYKFRIHLLSRIWDIAQTDPKLFWELRQTFLAVSYDEMVFKFWKPLDSFYPQSFLFQVERNNDVSELYTL